MTGKQIGLIIAAGVLIFISIITLAMWGLPRYRVYKLNLHGESNLKRQVWEKQIAIEDAKAKKESATLLAEAKVERAKGVAEANKIIGDSFRGNDAYLRYLWIQGLHDGSSETIYIPTEANLPILEATRMRK